MNADVILRADSIDGFLCTMGDCEDNCCRNTTWTISVDPVTYKKYEEMGGELGEFILSCIGKIDDGTYVFKQFDHGHCPLLAEGGLCRIHRDLGTDYLCDTCKTYPRKYQSFNGKLEYSLSLSCPDVVRWVLYRNKRINYTELTVPSDSVVAHPPAPHDAEKARVRDMLVSILHRHRYTLKEKIVYMGLFMRSISKCKKDENFSTAIDEVIEEYTEGMSDNAPIKELIRESISGIHPDNRKMMFKQLAQVAAACVGVPQKHPVGIKNEEFYHLSEAFYNDVADETSEKYLIDAFDRLVVPYVNEHSYVFENYLVYTFISSSIFCEEDDFSEAYVFLIGVLLINLIYAAGVFNKNEKLQHYEMIIAIYLFHRRVSHNLKLKEAISELIAAGWLPMLLGVLGGIE